MHGGLPLPGRESNLNRNYFVPPPPELGVSSFLLVLGAWGTPGTDGVPGVAGVVWGVDAGGPIGAEPDPVGGSG
jgi:hypothetical protein